MPSAIFLAPHPDPVALSHSLPDPSPIEGLRNPWGTFFDPPQPPDDRHGFPEAGPSRTDPDQHVSHRLARDDAAAPPQTQDAQISPAAMFLSAFSSPAQPTRLPDDEGETVAGYVLGPVIGRGGFSTIRRAFSPSGGVVAIKIVRGSDLARQADPSLTRKRLAHETEIWSSLSHEHILPLFSAQHTHYADFYVTLFCPAGSLFDILKRDGTPALPHDDAGMMFRQVVRGVRYLHEIAGYVHRDIKLENVLVDEMGVCRIADFGLTRKIGESDHEELSDSQDSSTIHRHRSAIHHTVRQSKPPLSPHASILRHKPRRHRTSTPTGDQSPAPVHPAHAFQPGSLPYAAPELLSPQVPGKHHGASPAQDMWALGCLLYALLTGRLPFFDPFEPRLTMKILHGVFDMPPNVGRGTSRLLKGCLERDVRIRWTIAMVDEMAWDIGWGQVDDSVSLGNEFDFVDFPNQPSASPRRRSRSLCDRNSLPDVDSSCTRRSLSRASVSSSSSLSTRSTSRSVSRPPTAIRLPLATPCDDVAHAVLNARTPEALPLPLDIGGSAPMSPLSLVERGRSRIKADPGSSSRFAPSLGASTALSDLGHEASRGRETYSGAERLDNTARWASALGLNTIAEVTTHLNSVSPPAMEKLGRTRNPDSLLSGKTKVGNSRAESTPPASSAWRVGRLQAGHKDLLPSLRQSAGIGGVFLRQPSATPIPIVRKNCKRSQSMGPEPDNTARRLF